MGGPPTLGMGTPGMMMSGMGASHDPRNLRYTQLLGWKADKLPIQFTIGRRGKWFQWTIAETVISQRSQQPYLINVDSGEAPELPSGLRRFWREITANQPRTTSSDRPDNAMEKVKNPVPPLNSDLLSNEPDVPRVVPVKNPVPGDIAPGEPDPPPCPVIDDPNKPEQGVPF